MFLLLSLYFLFVFFSLQNFTSIDTKMWLYAQNLHFSFYSLSSLSLDFFFHSIHLICLWVNETIAIQVYRFVSAGILITVVVAAGKRNSCDYTIENPASVSVLLFFSSFFLSFYTRANTQRIDYIFHDRFVCTVCSLFPSPKWRANQCSRNWLQQPVNCTAN